MTQSVQTVRIPIDEVVFRKDLYPRIETSAETVQKYAEALDQLPPIEVNQHKSIIDGWHRWTAHKEADAADIEATITETRSDAHFLELAIERNAKHGLQLSQQDKRDMAVQIYVAAPYSERKATRERLQRILSVPIDTLDKWLVRSNKELKDKARRKAYEMWLACRTQEEIAETVDYPKSTMGLWTESFSRFRQMEESGETDESEEADDKKAYHTVKARAEADHLTDFDPPIYNVWKQQEKTGGKDAQTHHGNSEVRWVDNLLYLYTDPFDIVIDPFAGSGSTVDLCRKRRRRYWVSDRLVPDRLEEKIRKHDVVTDGLPDLKGRWNQVRLVYLDPPYWKQAEGEYSEDPTDFGNMSLDDFNARLSGLVSEFAKKLKNGGEASYIALIIQPTQWNAPDRQFTDHVGDMLRAVKLPVDMRFSVPYESQQYNSQMVDWAKQNKKCLVLTREIVVWKVA